MVAISTCLPFTVKVPAVMAEENPAEESTTPETLSVVLREFPMLAVPFMAAAVASCVTLKL